MSSATSSYARVWNARLADLPDPPADKLYARGDHVRKALKALVRPIKEIADAIQRQDARWLTSLPGIGTATSEQIIATLRRKVTKFALMPERGGEGPTSAQTALEGDLIEDAYQALLGVGHTPVEARNRLDKVFASGRSFKSVQEILVEIYNQGA